MTPADGGADAAREIELRQLALVDRIMGLEAEVARLRIAQQGSAYARDDIERLENQIRAMAASPTWRAGRAVLAPLRAVRRLLRRG